MSSNIIDTRDARDRKVKQDTRAWAKYTDTNYTTALRQVESPFAKGFLGERVSARQLINTLDDHDLVGADDGDFILGEAGYYADTPWNFNQTSDFTELALLVDFLRMFTPLGSGEKPGVSSYALEHTAADFLGKFFPPASHVSNGRLIWAAAALDLPLVEEEEASPNLMIGISKREHDYVKRMVRAGHTKPRGHQHRPAGFIHLQAALEQCTAGEAVLDRWERPVPSTEVCPFHEWLIKQAGRGDAIGDWTVHYVAGVADSDHRIARTANEYLEILQEVGASDDCYESAENAVAEWVRICAPSQRGITSIRTPRIHSLVEEADVDDSDSGPFERHEFLCPCGEGKIVEEHDSNADFQDNDLLIECEMCSEDWRFVLGLSAWEWRLEPVTTGTAS
ncbi:hypothetical protein [Arthrobacter sp. GMC3]|uniref:hypothetical protein n=1 Tax=Arthrobacter sp. GMC3 TaxID=2058894 RepID=UPI000CE30772|nr:hypothetical protein [Arthrobacter sp. GMC3]